MWHTATDWNRLRQTCRLGYTETDEDRRGETGTDQYRPGKTRTDRNRRGKKGTDDDQGQTETDRDWPSHLGTHGDKRGQTEPDGDRQNQMRTDGRKPGQTRTNWNSWRQTGTDGNRMFKHIQVFWGWIFVHNLVTCLATLTWSFGCYCRHFWYHGN